MLRIYYSNEEYEPNKHKILTIYSDRASGGQPEDVSANLTNYSILEIEERYNPNWYKLYESLGRIGFLDLPDEFYVNSAGQIVKAETEQVFTINLNPLKQAYKLSQLYGLTHEQLDNHIDGISSLAEAKEFMRKQAHVVLWLVKQTKLDE